MYIFIARLSAGVQLIALESILVTYCLSRKFLILISVSNYGANFGLSFFCSSNLGSGHSLGVPSDSSTLIWKFYLIYWFVSWKFYLFEFSRESSSCMLNYVVIIGEYFSFLKKSLPVAGLVLLAALISRIMFCLSS